MNPRVIISRVMNDNFVIVLYKRLGIPEIMNIQLYINKVDILKEELNKLIYDVDGEVDYFGLCNGNNDFLFENFKKWKYLIKFHFIDNADDYIYMIRNLKNFILKEIETNKYNKEHKFDNKYTFNFNKK